MSLGPSNAPYRAELRLAQRACVPDFTPLRSLDGSRHGGPSAAADEREANAIDLPCTALEALQAQRRCNCLVRTLPLDGNFGVTMMIIDTSARRIVGRLTLAALATLAVGCHTAEGVKQDTKSALDASGKGLQKAATKIKGKDDAAPQKTDKKEDQRDAQAPSK